MAEYTVSVLEMWVRTISVEAPGPEAALLAVRKGEVDSLTWDEPDYIEDIEGTYEVTDEDGLVVLTERNKA